MKLYGCKTIVTGTRTTEFVAWHSTDKKEADAKIQFAKNITPPRKTTVEFTPIESDVVITTRGRYQLESGETVLLNYPSGIFMHGYRIVKGEAKMNQPVAFYLNGEPYKNLTRGKLSPIKALLVPYTE